MYIGSDDSVTFDLCFTRTLTFDSSFLYFDPMYENVHRKESRWKQQQLL